MRLDYFPPGVLEMSVDNFLKIHPVPFNIRNPYIDLLYSAIGEHQNIKVEEIDFKISTFCRKNIEVVHLHWLTGMYFIDSYLPLSILGATRFLILIFIVQWRGDALVWTAHNKYSHDCRHHFIEYLVRAYLVRTADVVIVHCKAAKKYYQNTYGEANYYIVPHGNYSPQYEVFSKSESRKHLGIDSDKTVLLNFGAVRDYKGQTELAKIVSMTLDRTELYIVGRPWDQEVVNKLRKAVDGCDRIHLRLEYVDEYDTAMYFAAADYVVLPYKEILTSGTALLSITLGRPLIVPDIGCIPEIVDESCGRLYRSQEELRNILNRIEEDDFPEFSSDDIRRRSSEFDWKSIARKHVNMYQGLS